MSELSCSMQVIPSGMQVIPFGMQVDPPGLQVDFSGLADLPNELLLKIFHLTDKRTLCHLTQEQRIYIDGVRGATQQQKKSEAIINYDYCKQFC